MGYHGHEVMKHGEKGHLDEGRSKAKEAGLYHSVAKRAKRHHQHQIDQTRQGAVGGLCRMEGAASGYYAAGERGAVHAGGWMGIYLIRRCIDRRYIGRRYINENFSINDKHACRTVNKSRCAHINIIVAHATIFLPVKHYSLTGVFRAETEISPFALRPA